MNVLASVHPLRVSYDISFDSIAANRSLLQKRLDYDEELADAFEGLISIASADADDVKSVDSVLETGFYLSAKSSFHSELMGAMSTLSSLDISPDGSDNDEKDEWEDLREHFHSPISPTSPTWRDHLYPITSPTTNEHRHVPTSPTSREHFRSPAPPAREHFHSAPPPSPLRRQISQ
jgi:hypothetical protein